MNERVVLAAVLLCASASLGAAGTWAQEKDKSKDGIEVTVRGKDTDAGLIIKAEATAKEVGLPLYPGSRPHKDNKDDSSSANLGLWGNTFGFKLVVLKMESDDATEKVAAFYQKALGKYGKVLDCTNNPPGADDKDKDKESNKLTCQDDRPDPGGRMFKAGSRSKQHIVGIKPSAAGSEFQLVYLESRSDDKTPL